MIRAHFLSVLPEKYSSLDIGGQEANIFCGQTGAIDNKFTYQG